MYVVSDKLQLVIRYDIFTCAQKLTKWPA